MFHNLEKQVHAAFRDRLRAQFGVDTDFALEQPRQASFGEIAVPIAFQLAKSLKRPPKQIATDLVAAVGEIPGVSAMEVAGNGYINIRFDRGAYAAALLAGADTTPAVSGSKVIVEHTNINPNKAAHHRASAQRPSWATRSHACCARVATTWKCRTTSTTPACRLPT